MEATDLAAAAASGSGVDCDGLRADADDDGYTLAVAGERADGLSRAEFLAAAADHPEHVANWRYWHRVGGRGTARRAFLRWVERAGERAPPERHAALRDGAVRTWGQLRIAARLGDGETGERTYALRHVEDAGADASGLDDVADPRALRDLVKTDERGRYRPLKTAPTLRSGWVLGGLSGSELVDAVDFVYPATVANWHREREGDLDVTHYREAAGRQTGIYELVSELEGESVEHLAEACCVDSQCLKRREWDEDAETPLDVPRGDGEFPCREPCSLVVSAARKCVTLEGEEPREYTFELTPSEKNQLEEILDAVADGRVDEIREADLDEGANRYRARYLRAKRTDEEGLCGVPTFDGQD